MADAPVNEPPKFPEMPRWVIAIMVLLLGTLLAGGMWIYHTQKQAAKTAAINDLTAIAHLKVNQITNWRNERISDAEVLARNPYVIENITRLLADPTAGPNAKFVAFLGEVQRSYHYTNILLANPKGDVVFSLNGYAQMDIAPEAFQAAIHTHRTLLEELHSGTDDPTPHLSAITPILSDDKPAGKLVGAIILSSNAKQFLYPMIQSWPTPSPSAETVLVRRDGDDVLFLNELRHQADTALKLRIALTQTKLPAAMAVLGQTGVVEGIDYRGSQVVSVLEPIPGSSWFMVSKIDAAEVYAGWRKLGVLILGMLLALVASIGAMGFVAWQFHRVVHFRAMYRYEAESRVIAERDSIILQSIGDAIIATDAEGRVELLNSVAETLTGWSNDQAVGMPLEQIFRIVHTQTRMPAENPVPRTLHEGIITGLANHTTLIRRDGAEFQIADSCAPVRGESGTILGAVLVFRDVTEEYERREELRASRDLLGRILENIPIRVFWKDKALRYVGCNSVFARDAGLSAPEDLIGKDDYQMTWREQAEQYRAADQSVMDSGLAQLAFEEEQTTPDGRTIYLQTSKVPLRDGEGQVVGILGIYEDITERKTAEFELRASEAKFRSICDAAQDAVILMDEKATISFLNGAAERMFGHTQQQTIGLNLHQLISPNHSQDAHFQAMSRFLASGHDDAMRQLLELTAVRKDGTEFPVELSLAPIRHGEQWHTVGILRDITSRKAMEDQLRAAAHTDKLTGLPNRALLLDRLQQAIERRKRLKESHYAVLFLDFDRFKTINDCLGHEMGDKLLREIGLRLQSGVRSMDSVSRPAHETTTARLGGDEFVVLLDGLHHANEAQLVADRLQEVLSPPYQLAGHEVVSTVSIGVVTSEYGHERADEVLRDADIAMYEAKLAGKGRSVQFDDSMRQRVQRNMELENGLRKALEYQQFVLHYQPIVSLESQRFEGFEALLRWNHPTHGLIPPGEFIAVAEETGLIIPIGEWVFHQATRQLALWQRNFVRAAGLSININLSRKQLLMTDLPRRLLDMSLEAGVHPASVHLEVTESAIMADPALALLILTHIKEQGFMIAMDDFGTGYSSLASLHQFPLDMLKIDRSFITNLNRGREFGALVQAIVTLAQNLHIAVIAEGVETADQLTMLQSLECQSAQGYYFAKPMTAEMVTNYLTDRQ